MYAFALSGVVLKYQLIHFYCAKSKFCYQSFDELVTHPYFSIFSFIKSLKMMHALPLVCFHPFTFIL